MQKITLIGPMGAGKSSIAMPLADKLGWQHIDIDTLIVDRHQKSIPRIFAEEGERQFRQYESDALKSAIEEKNNAVIATGGGILLQEENIARIAQTWVVYLKCNLDTLYSRVKLDKNRPLLQTENPCKTLKEIVEKREPLYMQCANQTIHTDEMSIPESIQKILSSAHA